MSQVLQLTEAQSSQVMQAICKGIGHYVKNENKTVCFDIGLGENLVICFDQEQCSVVDKKHLRETFVFTNSAALATTYDATHFNTTSRSNRLGMANV